jgi:hypothetical protein
MVARIDLDRLARLRRILRTSSSAGPRVRNGRIVLWDSATITDLMPLIDRPIANLEWPEGAVLLSHRRRMNDPLTHAVITPRDDTEVSFHEAHGEHPILGKRGELLVTPDLMRASDYASFTPEYIVYNFEEDVRYQGLANGQAVAVFGDAEKYSPELGAIAKIPVAIYGIPFRHSSIGIGDRNGPVEFEESLPNMNTEGLWTWLSGLVQNIACAIQHPDQFPITVERGDRAVTNRAQIRAARKDGLDLSDVRIVELRPHQVHERIGAGGRREYRYSFPVRGHWRHLQNGESVWVAGYWKAQDKPRLEVQTVERF